MGSHGLPSVTLLLLVAAVAILAVSKVAEAGDCSSSSPCADSSECCSEWGYCGSTDDYCGSGCVNGPCSGGGSDSPDTPDTSPTAPDTSDTSPTAPDTSDTSPTAPDSPSPPSSPSSPSGGGSGWTSFFSESTFSSWFPNMRSFYSYQQFADAANSYPSFGTSGSTDDQKRDIAAFFANVQQESGGLQYNEESNKAAYCDPSETYPCVPGKSYYGRGPLQISHNANYGSFGQSVGIDLLSDPDQVASDGSLGFKAAMWFWTTNGCEGVSFGNTIRIINGEVECDGKVPSAVANRVQYYQQFCTSLGVDPGNNLSC